MRVGLAWLCVLPLLAGSALAQDHFAGNDRATLHVRLQLAGSGRVDLPNGVEWFAIAAQRTLDVTYALADVGNDGLPIVGGVPDGAVPREMVDLENKLAECGDNQACLAATMMQFAQGGRGGPNPFAAMTGMEPGRYRNFAADRANGACADGRVAVDDILSGVVIPPPNPAVAYRFSRAGALSLPQDDFAVIEAVCAAEVSLDTQTGNVSLRLPLGRIGVPVTMGPTAFTHENSVPFVEGRGTLELLNQPSAQDGGWSGATDVDGVGSASHNSGQVGADLSGRISWRLSLQ